MVLTLLGGSLVLGTGLLAAAAFSDGALVAFRTASQLIGWLFVCAILLGSYARASRGEGWRGLRRAGFGEISAATITFLSGVVVLYVSYFEWGEIPHNRHAAAEVLVARAPDYKLIDNPPPAVTLASAQFIAVVARKDAPELWPAEQRLPEQRRVERQSPRKELVAGIVPARARGDTCASFSGVESLQCHRCVKESGLSLLMCQERARLEYCEARQGVEPTCPSAIPYSPPQ
jgi:hypothetical protein